MTDLSNSTIMMHWNDLSTKGKTTTYYDAVVSRLREWAREDGVSLAVLSIADGYKRIYLRNRETARASSKRWYRKNKNR